MSPPYTKSTRSVYWVLDADYTPAILITHGAERAGRRAGWAAVASRGDPKSSRQRSAGRHMKTDHEEQRINEQLASVGGAIKRLTGRRVHTQDIAVTRDVPLCGEAHGFDEYEYLVRCEMDDGAVDCARIVTRDHGYGPCGVRPPVAIVLTDDETQEAAERYAEALDDAHDAAREDAGDARRERERGL